HTKTGGRTIEVVTEAVLDTGTVVFGRPLDPAAWEFWIETNWIGALRRSRMVFRGAPRAALHDGSVAELRPNDEGKLTLDTTAEAGRAISLGHPPVNVALGTVAAFRMPLPAVRAAAPADLPADLTLVPVHAPGERSVIRGRLVATRGDARFEGAGAIPAGRYRLADADGTVPTRHLTLHVGRGGRARILHDVQPWTR